MNTTHTATRAHMNYSESEGRVLAHYFYDPGPDAEFPAAGTDVREVPVESAWGIKDRLSVDKEGFELHSFDPSFQTFDAEDSVVKDFYPQVIDFVKRHTGAKLVAVFDHTIRKRLPQEQMQFKKPSAIYEQQTTVKRPAVLVVHSDYTVASGPKRVREVMKDQAETLLKGRVAFFNVWKPLYRKVEELPLAMIDATTQQPGDLINWELRYADRTGEIYAMRYSPEHRWHYFPGMTADQALLLKTYDSETDGRCRFMGHSAFEDPLTQPNAQPRESIEVRTMAFF